MAREEIARLIGEVEFPGEYVLTPGETISSPIERAGGFTKEAFIDALRFRSADAKAQQQAAVERALLQAQKAAALVSNDFLQPESEHRDQTKKYLQQKWKVASWSTSLVS